MEGLGRATSQVVCVLESQEGDFVGDAALRQRQAAFPIFEKKGGQAVLHERTRGDGWQKHKEGHFSVPKGFISGREGDVSSNAKPVLLDFHSAATTFVLDVRAKRTGGTAAIFGRESNRAVSLLLNEGGICTLRSKKDAAIRDTTVVFWGQDIIMSVKGSGHVNFYLSLFFLRDVTSGVRGKRRLSLLTLMTGGVA